MQSQSIEVEDGETCLFGIDGFDTACRSFASFVVVVRQSHTLKFRNLFLHRGFLRLLEI
jgi:hypothetical protein